MKPNSLAAAILAIILFSLSNCEIKTQQSKASYPGTVYLNYREEVKSNMIYGIWTAQGACAGEPVNISVVNITKDKLEVELLKKQLK